MSMVNDLPDPTLVGDTSNPERDELLLLAEFQPGLDEQRYPTSHQRPLGVLSDFVCEELPLCNEAAQTGELSPDEYFGRVEDIAQSIDAEGASWLTMSAESTAARVASVDIAILERSLCVAYGGPTQEYRAKRAHARFFKIGAELARLQGRQVFLQWCDISNWYPAGDPRGFLQPGNGRDQEIYLCRVQRAIEQMHQRIVCTWPSGELTEEDFAAFVRDAGLRP